jgi:hypothetical protein
MSPDFHLQALDKSSVEMRGSVTCKQVGRGKCVYGLQRPTNTLRHVAVGRYRERERGT